MIYVYRIKYSLLFRIKIFFKNNSVTVVCYMIYMIYNYSFIQIVAQQIL